MTSWLPSSSVGHRSLRRFIAPSLRRWITKRLTIVGNGDLMLMNLQTVKEWSWSRVRNRTLLLFMGYLFMGTIFAQDAGQERAARAEGWQLQFQDNFERSTLGPQWETLDGSWYIADGRLQGTGQVFA